MQLSLLVLLASVFFSGFVLSIDQFSRRSGRSPTPAGDERDRLLQDLMLRGTTNSAWEMGALGAIALVTLVAAWLLLRRAMRTA